MSLHPRTVPVLHRDAMYLGNHGANVAREILASDLDDARVYAHLNQLEDLTEYRRALRLHDEEESQ